MSPYEWYFYSSGGREEHWTVRDKLVNRSTAFLGFGLGAILAFSFSQDLSQITPPPRAARAHASFLAITLRERNRLDHLAGDSNNASHRQAVRAALSADAATIDKKLTRQLDPS